MSSCAFPCDNQAFSSGDGAFKTAGDVVPLMGTKLQTDSNYTINRAVGKKIEESVPKPLNDNVLKFQKSS